MKIKTARRPPGNVIVILILLVCALIAGCAIWRCTSNKGKQLPPLVLDREAAEQALRSIYTAQTIRWYPRYKGYAQNYSDLWYGPASADGQRRVQTFFTDVFIANANYLYAKTKTPGGSDITPYKSDTGIYLMSIPCTSGFAVVAFPAAATKHARDKSFEAMGITEKSDVPILIQASMNEIEDVEKHEQLNLKIRSQQ